MKCFGLSRDDAQVRYNRTEIKEELANPSVLGKWPLKC